jgi:hypothetical protein
VRFLELHRNVNRLSKAGTDSIRDSLDQFSLGRLSSVVNSEDVSLLWLGIINLLDHSSQIDDVDSWDLVLSFSDIWQVGWLLEPSVLEVVVENSLSLTVKDTSRDNVSLEIRLVNADNFFFNFLDLLVFWSRVSHLVVFFSIWNLFVLLFGQM